MMKFILATTNKNKLSEINDISKNYGINFELPQIPFEVVEDGKTLYENALKKAQALVELQGDGQGNALKKAEFYPKGYPPLYGSTSFHLQEELLVGRSRANSSEPVTGNTNRWLKLLSRLWHPPSFHSGVFPTAVINHFALYSEAGSLSRLKLRTACAFFSLLWSFLRKLLHRPFIGSVCISLLP